MSAIVKDDFAPKVLNCRSVLNQKVSILSLDISLLSVKYNWKLLLHITWFTEDPEFRVCVTFQSQIKDSFFWDPSLWHISNICESIPSHLLPKGSPLFTKGLQMSFLPKVLGAKQVAKAFSAEQWIWGGLTGLQIVWKQKERTRWPFRKRKPTRPGFM